MAFPVNVMRADRSDGAVVVGIVAVVGYFAVLVHGMGAWPYEQWMVLVLVPLLLTVGVIGILVVTRDDSDRLTSIMVAGLVAKLGAAFVRYFVVFAVYRSGDSIAYDLRGRAIADAFHDGHSTLGSLLPTGTGTTFHRRPHRSDLHRDGPEPARRLPRLRVHRLLGARAVPPRGAHRPAVARRASLRDVALLHAGAGLLAVEHRQGSRDDARHRLCGVRCRSGSRAPSQRSAPPRCRSRPRLSGPAPRRFRADRRPRRGHPVPIPAEAATTDLRTGRAARQRRSARRAGQPGAGPSRRPVPAQRRRSGHHRRPVSSSTAPSRARPTAARRSRERLRHRRSTTPTRHSRSSSGRRSSRPTRSPRRSRRWRRRSSWCWP